ncbi:MurD UDP-N-acetylmuramoylalanine-D-glutamate ligase [Candidatus Nanopelagicaceae bacterium]
MAQALYTNLDGKRILVAGAGVTGAACARALEKRGSVVTIVDEKVTALEGFSIIKPADVDFSNFDLLLVSPGWREDHPVVLAARKARIALINEVDLAWSFKAVGQKWIALTGTNGKTSTVELTAAMLRSGGISSIACGNVGTTVIETVESAEKYDILVLELSSFQLHWLEDAQFVSSAILNIAEDHVDWHGSFDAYAQDKISLLDKSMTAILNGDDGEIVSRTNHWQGRKVFFSLDTPAPGEIGVVEELLVDRAFVADPQEAAMISELIEVTPTVPHNVSNTLAAAGLARTVGVGHEAIRSAITEFTPGRHRIEKVLERDGITWINDSKATNPHAASASIMSALSVIWIAGGLAKGATMGQLVDRIKARVRVAILIGEDRELIASELLERAPHIEIIRIDTPAEYSKGGESNALMESVIRSAKDRAISGDTVLLAPACASMDQFISYGDRGDRFRAAVEKVVRDGN